MIQIRYHEETNEIDLGGTQQELQCVRRSILHFLLQTDEAQISIPAAVDFDPAPYPSCLSVLNIRKSKGSIKVAVSIDCLEVEGDASKLEAFADWFDFDSGTSQYHCHFEYFPGNTWIDSDSLPLVISVRY